jgi:hypothetical protein
VISEEVRGVAHPKATLLSLGPGHAVPIHLWRIQAAFAVTVVTSLRLCAGAAAGPGPMGQT